MEILVSGSPLLFYLLLLLLAGVTFRVIINRRAIFEFPTLTAMLGLAWIVPQGIELGSVRNSLYNSNAFWSYVIGCYLLIQLGFALGKRKRQRNTKAPPIGDQPQYKIKRLIVAAGCLTAVGMIAQLLIGGVDTSGMGGQWTGVITLYALLTKANSMGLCLSVLIFAHCRSRAALAIAVIAALPILYAAMVGVRREQIFVLLLLTFGGWYIARRRFPPRVMVIASLVVCTVVLNTAGKLREFVGSGQGTLVTAVLSPETYQKFNYAKLEQGRSSEVGQAQFDFNYMNTVGEWELGAEYWNSLSNQYVPAFLLGREFKESFKIPTLSERLKNRSVRGAFALGSTRTGFSDSYRSFGVFGILVFGAIAFIFGYIYNDAVTGGISGQYFYLIFMAEGLKSITHSTSEFFSALPFVGVMSIVAFQYSKIRTRIPTRADTDSLGGFPGG